MEQNIHKKKNKKKYYGIFGVEEGESSILNQGILRSGPRRVPPTIWITKYFLPQ
jgi:hypothetical protein